MQDGRTYGIFMQTSRAIMSLALYYLAIGFHALSLIEGLVVLACFEDCFRNRTSRLVEARYWTVAGGTIGNLLLGVALTFYLHGGLNQPPQLELIFSCGHFLTALLPAIWHAITYVEMSREDCGGI